MKKVLMPILLLLILIVFNYTQVSAQTNYCYYFYGCPYYCYPSHYLFNPDLCSICAELIYACHIYSTDPSLIPPENFLPESCNYTYQRDLFINQGDLEYSKVYQYLNDFSTVERYLELCDSLDPLNYNSSVEYANAHNCLSARDQWNSGGFCVHGVNSDNPYNEEPGTTLLDVCFTNPCPRYPTIDIEGKINLPQLFVDLRANPREGQPPLNTNLTAYVLYDGSPSDPINYTFWWNCSDPGTSVAWVKRVCGDPDGASGNSNGIKFDGILDDPKTVSHTYNSSGVYTAKVIVERGSLSAEDRELIIVPGPVSLTLATDSQNWQDPLFGNAPLKNVDLKAEFTGSIPSGVKTYNFDCQTDGTIDAKIYSESGVVIAEDKCNYSSPGAYFASVIVETLSGEKFGDFATVVVNSPPEALNVEVTEPDYCTSGVGATVSFVYSDLNLDPMSAYQVQIDDIGSSFTSPEWDSGIVCKTVSNNSTVSVNTGSCSPANPSGTGPGTCRMDWNKTYKARARVWDSRDKPSQCQTASNPLNLAGFDSHLLNLDDDFSGKENFKNEILKIKNSIASFLSPLMGKLQK